MSSLESNDHSCIANANNGKKNKVRLGISTLYNVSPNFNYSAPREAELDDAVVDTQKHNYISLLHFLGFISFEEPRSKQTINSCLTTHLILSREREKVLRS